MFKRIVSVLTIFAFLWCIPVDPRPADAIVGTVVAGAVGTLGALVVAGAAAYYYAPVTAGSGDYGVSPLGDLGRSVNAVWYALNQYQKAEAYRKLMSLKILYDDLLHDVVQDPNGQTLYPNLFLAMTNNGGLGDPTRPNVGDIDKFPWSSGYYKITKVNPWVEMNWMNWPPTNFGMTSWPNSVLQNRNNPNGTGGEGTYVIYQGSLSQQQEWWFCEVNYLPSDPPKAVPKMKQDFATDGVLSNPNSNVSGSPPGSNLVRDTFKGDIDKYLEVHPDKAHPVDTTTPGKDLSSAPPFVAPAGAVNPDKVGDLSGAQSGTTTVPGQTALDSAGQALDTAKERLAATQLAVDNYRAAHPDATAENDAHLAELLKDLADAQKGVDTATDTKTQSQVVADTPLVEPTVETIKTLNFERLRDLLGVLSNKFPFTLLATLGALLTPLMAPPTAPSFDFPLPLAGNIHIDLAAFDPVAAVSRWVIGIGLTIGIIIIVYRRFTD